VQLVRVDHAADRLGAGHRAARVAAESDYVDQSHLHRDVMALAGVTPRAVAVVPWLAADDVAWVTPEHMPQDMTQPLAQRPAPGLVALATTANRLQTTPSGASCKPLTRRFAGVGGPTRTLRTRPIPRSAVLRLTA
jgi:hypothetical protein